jgi:hypothetical protein
MKWLKFFIFQLREMKNAYKIFVRKLKGRENSEVLGAGGRIILKENSRK